MMQAGGLYKKNDSSQKNPFLGKHQPLPASPIFYDAGRGSLLSIQPAVAIKFRHTMPFALPYRSCVDLVQSE